MGAWMVQSVPWVWRQMEQWQKCVGRGREDVGRVIVRVERLQWQCACRVVIATVEAGLMAMSDVIVSIPNRRRDGNREEVMF